MFILILNSDNTCRREEGQMNKSIIICFLGMDGSGKSTLSSFLVSELKKSNYIVIYHWWLEGESSILRRTLRKIFRLTLLYSKQPETVTKHIPNKGKKILFSWFFPRIVLTDYLVFGFFRVTIHSKIGMKKVFVFDRYYPDTICSLKKEFGLDINNMLLIRLYPFLLPEPDLIFLIDVPPELALQRKKEEIQTIENARIIWNDQKNIRNIIPYTMKTAKIVRIDNSKDIEISKYEILKNTMKYLNNY